MGFFYVVHAEASNSHEKLVSSQKLASAVYEL
jgi:hypothetical protein